MTQVQSINDAALSRRLFPDLAEKLIVAAAVCQPGFYTSLRNELRPADFQLIRHIELWAACERVADAGNEVNVGTLALDLAEYGGPAGCDLAFLMDLDAAHVPVPNPAPYLAAIREAARHRRALTLLTKARAETELEGFRPERVRATLAELERLGDEPTGSSEIDRLPDVLDGAFHGIRWAIPGILPLAAVTTLISPGGHGKSTVSLAWGTDLALGGRDVLILDAENGADVVGERLQRLNLTQTPPRLKIWGGWNGTVPDPSDERIMAWARAHPEAVIVADPLIAFLARAGVDENEASAVRRWYDAGARLLAQAGAAVLISAHAGKAGPGYRGSSAILDATDVMFDLENINPGGDVHRLTLRAAKRRFPVDRYVSLEWDARQCEFVRRALTRIETNTEICERVLKANPGCGTRAFIEAAQKAGASFHAANQFLESGVTAGTVRRETAGRSHKHFWMGGNDES